MPYPVRDQLAALCCVQLSLPVKEHIHIHAAQLCNTLLLRHLIVQTVNLLLQIINFVTVSHKQQH